MFVIFIFITPTYHPCIFDPNSVQLRQMYLIFLAMKDSGKFDWDDDTGTPTASEYTWERYLAVGTLLA